MSLINHRVSCKLRQYALIVTIFVNISCIFSSANAQRAVGNGFYEFDYPQGLRYVCPSPVLTQQCFPYYMPSQAPTYYQPPVYNPRSQAPAYNNQAPTYNNTAAEQRALAQTQDPDAHFAIAPDGTHSRMVVDKWGTPIGHLRPDGSFVDDRAPPSYRPPPTPQYERPYYNPNNPACWYGQCR